MKQHAAVSKMGISVLSVELITQVDHGKEFQSRLFERSPSSEQTTFALTKGKRSKRQL